MNVGSGIGGGEGWPEELAPRLLRRGEVRVTGLSSGTPVTSSSVRAPLRTVPWWKGMCFGSGSALGLCTAAVLTCGRAAVVGSGELAMRGAAGVGSLGTCRGGCRLGEGSGMPAGQNSDQALLRGVTGVGSLGTAGDLARGLGSLQHEAQINHRLVHSLVPCSKDICFDDHIELSWQAYCD